MPFFSKTASALAASKKQNKALLPSHKKCNGRNTLNATQQGSGTIQYRDIDSAKKEIRLLLVLQGNPGDPIRCQILTTFLGTKKQLAYETVSYCWGQDPGEAQIEIDHLQVKITKSARDVIHRMRASQRSRLIWIDAVCINQGSIAERSAQVGLMGEIYQRTWCNWVWLGDDQDQFPAVQKAVQEVVNDMYSHRHELAKLCANKATATVINTRSGNMMDRKINLLPLEYIFKSDWFHRLWVVQEVALPPRSMCMLGPGVLNLIDVLRVAFWLEFNSSCVPANIVRTGGLLPAKTLQGFIDDQFSAMSGFDRRIVNLENLWYMFFKLGCKDPKDRIYALLGLCPRTPIKPDYDKPDFVVFAEVTRQMIEESGRVDVLASRFTTGIESPPILPSWSVRFALRAEICPEHFAGFFSASGRTRVPRGTILQAKDPFVLSLSGILVDEACVLSKRLGVLQGRDIRPVLQHLQDVTREHKSHKYYVERLGTTLMGGRNMQDQAMTAQDMSDFAVYIGYLQKYRKNPPVIFGTESLNVDVPTRMASRAHGAFIYTCSLRRFFITKCGRFGVGPDGMMEGDLIAVLNGGKWPFALRYAGKGRFYLIGACYVEGIMYGEAALRHKTEGGKDDIFHIL